MATRKQQTMNYKRLCLWLFVIFLIFVGRWAYLKVSSIYLKKATVSLQEDLNQESIHLNSFSDKPWYDKLLYVKQLESESNMMPRSDHVNAIMSIFDELLAVDNSDTFNIAFSDFHISLEEITLHWYVTNLRLLYQWANWNSGLISKFEDLDFLDNISIKTYEKSQDNLGYEFVLNANVVNNGK